ncbi:wd40 repeat-containing protein [Blastocystis sp. subtype 4]|uniref:wd40 repeat-containing protein n=1 Tax=Blastocystis sp. subtype 4 TaxID=944170 RepID=UPI00071172E3|nr:wd40 repeat-containing protein [Blastocystis sp. subtype 4]KNB44445.1 wd40 repeat-containing protein [Blastocystis sp. subtype 4]|eukprot:XP_014527881.1 wd40 repeat-containing protein [Blastocystis sp. subtype 4]
MSLPDYGFDLIPEKDYFDIPHLGKVKVEAVINILLGLLIGSGAIALLCHGDHFLLFRRIMLMLGITALLRPLIFTMTSLPDPCEWGHIQTYPVTCNNQRKTGHFTLVEIINYTFTRLKNPKNMETQGDMLFSGMYEVIDVKAFGSLITKDNYITFIPLFFIVLTVALFTCYLILLCRFHYSVDVFMAILIVVCLWLIICESAELATYLVYQSFVDALSNLCVGTTTSDSVFVGKPNLDYAVMDFEAEPSDFSRKRITGHYGTVSLIKCLDWNCTGELLASCSSDSTVRIWNSHRSYKCEYSFSFKNHISQVKWNPVAADMIACTFDKEIVKIWNIDNEDSMLTIKLLGYTDFLSWSPDGKFIAVENDKGTMYIIDVSNGTYTAIRNNKNASSIVDQMRCVGEWIQRVCLWHRKEVSLNLDGVGRVDMIVYNEETRSFQNEGSMDCHMGECTTIDMDRKHRNIVTGSTDTFISIIDCNEMITLKTFKCHK